MHINFKIVTPEKVVIEKEISQATIPTVAGEVTILPNHRSYIAGLKAGEILVKCVEGEKGGKDCAMAVSGGFIEFADNKLVVLADTAERAEDLDLARAEEAKKRAEELKKRKLTDEREYAIVAAQLEKEMARIKVAKKWRKL
jgi:F-type H+-transporting ATPase subunit epsilon